MNCVYSVIISFLFVMGLSLTFNLDDANSDTGSTVLIFHKNKPSILIFPNRETITLKYPKQNLLTKLELGGSQPIIAFKDLNMVPQEEVKQKKLKPKSKETKEEENIKEKQVSNQIPKPVRQKYAALVGNYKLANPKLLNLQRSIILSIKDKHISYTLCSQNTCQFSQQKDQIEIGSCTLVSQSSCQAFSDLFYSNLRLLAQLELIDHFIYKNGVYKFYDKLQQLRVELVRAD